MTTQGSTLIAHKDCQIIPFSQLEALPIPEGTDTFKPVPHSQLALSMKAVLDNMGYEVIREQYAVNSLATKMFGTFDLSHSLIPGTSACVGFRQGIDRSMKIQIIAGSRVFVCDNMAFSGSFIALNRKHTAGLNLLSELLGAFGRYFQHLAHLTSGIEGLQALELADVDAKQILFDAFVGREVMPLRYLRNVAHEYFEPTHEEFKARNAWSLHNAFTAVIKGLPLNLQLSANQKVGKVFDLGVAQGEAEAAEEVIE